MLSPASYRRRAATILAGALISLLLLFPVSAPQAAMPALRLCLTLLIPSLFPMLVLTGFLSELGIGKSGSKRGLLSRMLGTGQTGARIFLLGAIAGFPHAARLCSKAVERGEMSAEEADRVTAFSSIPGPAFLIGAVGQGMLDSALAGVLLYAIQLISALLTAITLRVLFRVSYTFQSTAPSENAVPSILTALAASIRDGAGAMLGICGAVTFFAIVQGLLTTLLPEGAALLLLGGFLEITSCAASCVEGLPHALLCPALSLLFAWSGCSVHAQIALASQGRFPLRHYFVGKLLSCLYAMVLGVLLQKFL